MSYDCKIWNPVVGYEGIYEVSNDGYVRSLDRWSYHSFCKREIFQRGRVLKLVIHGTGYPCVSLHKGGKMTLSKVHRLVAEAFIPLVEGKNVVNHINGIKTDNRVENLEWCTNAENVKHAHINLDMNYTPRGDKSPFAKPIIQKSLSGSFIKRWGCQKDAVEQLGLNTGNLARVLRGLNKSHKGFVFEYDN